MPTQYPGRKIDMKKYRGAPILATLQEKNTTREKHYDKRKTLQKKNTTTREKRYDDRRKSYTVASL